MLKALGAMVAVLLIVVGLIVLPMPLPFGAIMIASGIVLLVSVSAAAALRMKTFRRNHRGFDGFVRKAERYLPESWRKALKRTDP